MAEPMKMDDILSDAEPEKPEAPAKDVPQETKAEEVPKIERPTSSRQRHRDLEQAAQGRERDPVTGQYLPKKVEPEKPAEESKPAEPKAEAKPAETKPEAAPKAEAKPPAQEFTEKERAFLAAAQEERRKRQELERKLAEAQAAQKPQEPAKGFWDDPEGALKRHQEEVQQAMVGTRLSTSEVIARGRYQDFDAKVAKFAELAQTIPGLAQQMLAAPDPAEFAYRTAANHMMVQDAGGVDKLIERARAEAAAEARAKLEAELKAREEALRKEREALPGSLSQARGAPVNKPVWGGPTPMDSILKGD